MAVIYYNRDGGVIGNGDWDYALNARGAATDDEVIGGNGNDNLWGGFGSDKLYGGGGDDVLFAAGGDDWPFDGYDYLYGGDGDDHLHGTGWLYGGDGNDMISGGRSNGSYLDGGDGDDDLNSYGDNNTLLGGAGDDNLDALLGGGNWLHGGEGNDILMSGPKESGDATTYRFNRGDGQDAIWDRSDSPASRDVLELGEGILPSEVTAVRANTNRFYIPDTGFNDLLLSFANSETDQIIIAGQFSFYTYSGIYRHTIEEIHFADGTVWDWDFDQGSFVTRDVGAPPDNPGDDTLPDDDIVGTPEADTLTGTASNNRIFGLEGDDHLGGGAGDDILYGGEGYDSLAGGSGDDRLYGEAGEDVLEGGDGDDILDGGADRDALYGGDGDDALYGGDADDWLWGDDGDDLLEGGTGDDYLNGGLGNDTYRFDRGDGRDTICDLGDAVGRDVLAFGEGILAAEVVAARVGDDLELHFAGNGADKIIIENHFLIDRWQRLIEEIHFADGTVWDGEGIPFRENIVGTDAAETLVGGAGDNYLASGAGNDILRAVDGDDILDAGDDNDTLYAGRGNDVLLGGEGNDRLYGEAGDDNYRGGAGDDTLYDSQGNETYHFALGDGADTILDTQGEDTLIFERIDYTQLWFQKTGVNGRNLEIGILDTDDKVTITDWFAAPSRQIEHIQAGGLELAAADVQALVDALAAYVPQPIDLDIDVPSLDDLLGNYWDAV